MKIKSRSVMREIRHARLRKNVSGTAAKPRMAVFHSLSHIYVQFIDDEAGHTLAAASTVEPSVKASLSATCNIEAARMLGKIAAERALAKGINAVVFDRGGHMFHGKVKALADSAREAGLKF
ncbi:MAG: 50S ribosomal protein L18 [Synergistaceae bacterium]|jgi:large subunit ribosomal protein L18|uniref:50S ribosomal protein L18 n=1 Tax=Aminivibrio sp. TaxID=1872489 RepID=UPI0016B55325|nr:50S ribosomal protein L18 [Synergistaceae bacterium]NCC56082.1 50S ribosomal protein L18 [Synergistales bacterium]MDD3390331.1 50S ribosomal protein L18 [Synergistaceae bacterium]MDD3688671.1 50S ribosomal protein L18 [Synergistaceae bacterium]MDD4020777.1 50S ribosomal protein L18 [Synergistaceae bacterium]